MPGEMLQIGSVTKAAGMVSVRHPDGSSGELLVGNPVYQGDQVQTGADGAVGITLNDKSAFSLGPKGAMQLDELVYDPAAPADGHSTVAAMHGAFTAVSGDIAKAAPGAMHIKTPVMTIGVRGTTVAGMAAAEGSQNTVTLMRDGSGTLGQVSISNAGGTQVLSGESHTLQLSSFIQPPPPPVALSAAQIQQLYGSALSAQPVPPAPPPANPAPPAPPAPSGNTDGGLTQQAPVTPDPNPPSFIDAAGMIAAAVEGDKEREKEVLDGVLTDLTNIGQSVGEDINNQETQIGELVQDMAATEQAFLDFLAGLDDLKDQFDLPDDILEEIRNTNFVFGTSNSEVLYGTDGRDVIYPEPGVDTVYAGAGDDIVEADGDEVDDTFYGGDGIDTISYAAASHGHIIDLSAGTATAGYGIDYISGFEVAVGSIRDDTIKGSAGDDFGLYGNGGNDTFIETDGTDFIDGGAGDHDLISFVDASNGIEVNLGSHFVINDGWGNVGTVREVEDVRGSNHDDIITGDDNANVLEGMAGDDNLSGGGGDDTFIEGAGTDVMNGGAGAHDLISFATATGGVSINLQTGIIGADGFGGFGTVSGIEDVTGGTSADTITGDNNANVLDGAQGDDVLSGGDGDDTLTGGLGLDQLTGGAGNDVFKFQMSGMGTDTITDYTAGDRIWLSADAFNLTPGATNFLFTASDWSAASLDNLTGAGVIAIINGSNVELWYNGDLSTPPDSTNSYQIATLQSANAADVSVIAG